MCEGSCTRSQCRVLIKEVVPASPSCALGRGVGNAAAMSESRCAVPGHCGILERAEALQNQATCLVVSLRMVFPVWAQIPVTSVSWRKQVQHVRDNPHTALPNNV